MRRWPRLGDRSVGPWADKASPSMPTQDLDPTDRGDVLVPFVASGGQTYYASGWGEAPTPELGAVQLVCMQYVPRGRTGFVKRVMIAPCCPPILSDPWRGWDAFFNWFELSSNPNASRYRAAPHAGIWETPLAWEGYFNSDEAKPRWSWSLTIAQGDLLAQRASRGLGPFDPADPATFWAVPDVAVPQEAYQGGLIGRAVNGHCSNIRIQAPPRAEIPVHIPIPEDSTVCLWAQWTQTPIAPLAQGPAGPLALGTGLTWIVPLLPSVGQIVGYYQTSGSEAAREHGITGWGG